MRFGLLQKYIVLGLIIVVFGGGTIYYVQKLFLPQVQEITDSTPMIPPGGETKAPPSFSIVSKDKNTLIVRWDNLPPGADIVEIFRKKFGTDNWLLWKTIATSGIGSGTALITLSEEGSVINYSYFFQAVTTSSEVIVNTSNTPIELNQSTPTSTPPQTPPAESPTAPAPTSTPETTPTSTPPVTPPDSNGSSTVYYTPDGQISSSTSPAAVDFWAQHVNKYIEIGWQNLPPSTDKLIIYRSVTDQGSWSKLLEQQNPVVPGPSYVRLVDNTLNESYYYQMDIYANGNIIKTGGPVLLPPLSQ